MHLPIPSGERDDALDLHSFSRVSESEFKARLDRGERFVVYHYTLSAIIYTTTRPTKIFNPTSRRKALMLGLPYTLISIVLGWWSLTGFIWTITSIIRNSSGGTDVSGEILAYIRQQDPRYLYGMR